MSIFKNHKTSADRSATDRSRHRKKIKEAIKEGVHHIVSEESIIGKDGKKRIKIPVKGIKEYKFVYGNNSKNKQVGSAHDKNVRRGQKISNSRRRKKDKNGSGKPGNEKGEEMYEVEVSLEEMAAYLFDDLNLPDLEKKNLINIVSEKFKRHGYRKNGILPRLSKKETLKNKIKRKKAYLRNTSDEKLDEDEDFPFHKSDLKYKNIKRKNTKNSNAVIFFLMDTSGSMTKNKKFLARSFFFLMYHFLRYRYDKTEIVFVSHTSEAKEVNEDDFFKKVSSGGTLISSGLEKCIDIVNSRYHSDFWNIYLFHCTDGDNWPEDNKKTMILTEKLKDICQLYGFIQTVTSSDYHFWSDGGIVGKYNQIKDSKLKVAHLEKKADVWHEFKRMMGGTE